MSGATNPTTGQPTPEGDSAPDTNTTPAPMFTQDQVTSIATKEKREGRKALITELEALTGYTFDELKTLKKQTQPDPVHTPATPAPASTPAQSNEVLELVRAMAARQEALEAKLMEAETKKAQEALQGKAKTSGVWDQFMDKVTSEEAIEATLAMQKTILEQHGAGVKKPAPTTHGGTSSNVRDVATNDVMSPEEAAKKLQEIGGI